MNFILRHQENLRIQSCNHYWFSLKKREWKSGDKQTWLWFSKRKEIWILNTTPPAQERSKTKGSQSSNVTKVMAWEGRQTLPLGPASRGVPVHARAHSHSRVGYRPPLPLLWDISNHICVFTPSRVKAPGQRAQLAKHGSYVYVLVTGLGPGWGDWGTCIGHKI